MHTLKTICVGLYGLGGLWVLFLMLPSSGQAQDIRQISLLSDSAYPEGIAVHTGTGDIFVGNLADGAIQRVHDSQASYFKAAHADGLMNVIGLTIDPERNRLWVCNTDFAGVLAQQMPKKPELVVFDTESGALLGRYAVPGEGPHFFNDVVLDAQGNAYVTDSMGSAIYTVDHDLEGIELFVESPLFTVNPQGFNLNGIAVTPNQKQLITVIPAGANSKLFRVSMDTKEVSVVTFPSQGFNGGDGLVFLSDTEMLSINRGGITRVRFEEDYTKGSAVSFPSVNEHLNFATTADIMEDRLYVTNSQLDHFVSFFEAARQQIPPDTPFTISVIPLRLLR